MPFNRILKIGLIIAGTIFTVLGFIGIFVPLLPTTPFLLLAAACYARSSKKIYAWLLNNKLCGKYIKGYIERKGLPFNIKLFSIVFLWTAIVLSALFVVMTSLLKILLLLIAICVSVHVLHIKTFND
ncbi:MAG: YbaN family protein [Elusimicrobiales bacterium]|nr:YbaN family protein [Elusimicrobiales bacterium]